jgi:hypothetical protein
MIDEAFDHDGTAHRGNSFEVTAAALVGDVGFLTLVDR